MKVFLLVISIILISPLANAGSYEHLNRNNFQVNDDKMLRKQSIELESVLISKMIEPMFPDGKESGLYGGGHGSDIFRQMVIDQYSKTLAESNTLGLAENIEKDLKK